MTWDKILCWLLQLDAMCIDAICAKNSYIFGSGRLLLKQTKYLHRPTATSKPFIHLIFTAYNREKTWYFPEKKTCAMLLLSNYKYCKKYIAHYCLESTGCMGWLNINCVHFCVQVTYTLLKNIFYCCCCCCCCCTTVVQCINLKNTCFSFVNVLCLHIITCKQVKTIFDVE